MYFRGAKAAVVVCDCTNMESFRRCETWIEDLRSFADENCAITLAANKIDKVGEGGIVEGEEVDGGGFSLEEAEGIARKFKIPIHTTSAFTGEGVEDLFTDLVVRAVENNSAAVEAAAAVAAVAAKGGGVGEDRKRVGGGGDGLHGGTIKLDEGGGGDGNGKASGGGGSCC